MREVIERAADSGGMVVFPDADGGPRQVSVGELAHAADREASLLASASEGGVIAAVLTNDEDSVRFVLAAMLAGLRLVSLPLPARRMDAQVYRAGLRRLVDSVGANTIWVSPHYAELFALLDDPDLRFRSMHRLPAGHGGGTGVEPSVVQFSSGTTGPPHGVVVPAGAIRANADAVIRRLDLGGEDTLCSWLPLSHDMGLVGAVFTSLELAGRCDAHESPRLVLLRPETFLRAPGSWFAACAEHRATLTMGPAFALRAAARGAHAPGADQRCILVGGDLIAPASLCALEDDAAIRPGVLCPAWGMAEATLALTVTAPGGGWDERAAPDRDAPGPPTRTYVSCGPPLDGVEVRVEPDGRLAVRSPSLGADLAGRPFAADDGWYTTADSGFVADGRVYVTGRHDDVITLGAANVHAGHLEAILSEVLGTTRGSRLGVAVAVVPAEASFAVLVERLDALGTHERSLIETVCVGQWGSKPLRVVAVERIPRTPSGKVARAQLGELAG